MRDDGPEREFASPASASSPGEEASLSLHAKYEEALEKERAELRERQRVNRENFRKDRQKGKERKRTREEANE